jgi:predicted phosphodiesterase
MKIGIISDIHEDTKRLKETFIILHKEKCQQIVCLGDFTGYSVPYYGFLQSRNAHAVIEMLKKKCKFSLIGNHDLFSIKKLPKNKANFSYPKNWYSLDYQTRKKLSNNKLFLYEHHTLPPLLTKGDKQFMRQLPEYVIEKYNGLKILFSHYAFPDLVGTKIFKPETTKDVKQHFTFMKKHGCTLGISGHDHYEGIIIFTEDKVSKIPFNKTIKLTNNPTWLHGPSVANSEFANGVLVFDTDKMKIKAIPLKSKVHILPKWRKL